MSGAPLTSLRLAVESLTLRAVTNELGAAELRRRGHLADAEAGEARARRCRAAAADLQRALEREEGARKAAVDAENARLGRGQEEEPAAG